MRNIGPWSFFVQTSWTRYYRKPLQQFKFTVNFSPQLYSVLLSATSPGKAHHFWTHNIHVLQKIFEIYFKKMYRSVIIDSVNYWHNPLPEIAAIWLADVPRATPRAFGIYNFWLVKFPSPGSNFFFKCPNVSWLTFHVNVSLIFKHSAVQSFWSFFFSRNIAKNIGVPLSASLTMTLRYMFYRYHKVSNASPQ